MLACQANLVFLDKIMVTDFTQLATIVGQALQKRSLKLAIAESCTGGLASFVMTSIPGSTSWFDRGFVTYSDISKQEMLDVSAKTLKQFGAVSAEISKEMAKGALKNSHAQVGIAITGFAGPGGGTPQNPVGTTYFTWVSQQSNIKTVKKIFSGNRKSVCEQAVNFALQGLLAYLK
jgi:nicotinamide-nucleotide amidase